MADDPASGRDNQRGFERRLTQARDKAGLDRPVASPESRADGPNPFSLAMRLGAEMVASLVVAVAIGYGLDRLFHSAPWFMIGFVPLGAVAGLRNVVRAMGTTKKD